VSTPPAGDRAASGPRIERTGPGGTVARVTLARREVRNAMDAVTIGALRAAFRGFTAEPAAALRAVVLAGDGPVFCAGADLGWMRDAIRGSPGANESGALELAEMYAAIDACPVPVIARVQGAALGGGAGLCAVADVVVADAGARFGFPEARLGLIPATIAPYVVARIGEGRARALFATGRRIGAADALRIGLVDEVADGSDALDRAIDEAIADVLAGGPEATRAAKQLLRDLRTTDPASVAATTARALALRRGSAEAAEGLRSVEQRRSPAWAEPGD
jgi:methylglutaconyl-CoA hydratase